MSINEIFNDDVSSIYAVKNVIIISIKNITSIVCTIYIIIYVKSSKAIYRGNRMAAKNDKTFITLLHI